MNFLEYDDILEGETLVYLSDCNKVVINKDTNANILYFKIYHDGRKIETHDVMEAVSILIKIDKFKDDKVLWGIKIDSFKTEDINYFDVLYWLVGGKDAMPLYKNDWLHISELFIKKYKRTLNSIFKNSKKLGDVRKLILKKIPMQSIYDFSIKKDIFK